MCFYELMTCIDESIAFGVRGVARCGLRHMLRQYLIDIANSSNVNEHISCVTYECR